jgi:prevent-host-death family protein
VTPVFNKTSVADARKKFADIISRVAYGKESFVLTRRGQPLAAIVSIDDLRLLQEIEEHINIDGAWKARNESNENISWKKLREELEL